MCSGAHRCSGPLMLSSLDFPGNGGGGCGNIVASVLENNDHRPFMSAFSHRKEAKNFLIREPSKKCKGYHNSNKCPSYLKKNPE